MSSGKSNGYKVSSWIAKEGEHKESSCCGTTAKKKQNLQPAASIIIIVRLRHHQDSQVTIHVDTKL